MRKIAQLEHICIAKVDQTNKEILYQEDLFWIIGMDRGSIHFKTMMHDFSTHEKEIYLLAPNNVLNITHSEKFTAYCIGFSAEFAHAEANDIMLQVFDLFFDKIMDPAVPLSRRSTNIYMSLAYLMITELQRKDYSGSIVNGILRIILEMLLREKRISNPQKVANYNVQRVYSFFQLAYNNYTNIRETKYYARQLNISEKRLNQILQQYVHKSIKTILNEMLMMDAKRELMKKELTVNEISDKLGFQDRAYFSRFFKKMTGMAPSEFRK